MRVSTQPSDPASGATSCSSNELSLTGFVHGTAGNVTASKPRAGAPSRDLRNCLLGGRCARVLSLLPASLWRGQGSSTKRQSAPAPRLEVLDQEVSRNHKLRPA